MKKISLFNIIKYNFKTIFKEKSFLVLNFLMFLASVIIGIYSIFQKNGAQLLLVFDYFLLVTLFMVLFLIIVRLIQFFYGTKISDKTLNIIISQKISRGRLFTYNFLFIIILIFLNLTMTFLNIWILNALFTLKLNLFLLKIIGTYFVYALISCLCFTSFLLLIIFLSNVHTLTIVATLLIALSFINNLPYLFLQQGEVSKNLNFSYTNDGETNQILFKVDEVNNSYSLKRNVAKGQIKYPNISQEIYNNFLTNQYITDNGYSNGFQKTASITKRLEFWKSLGIIEENQTESFNLDWTSSTVKIVSLNRNFTDLGDWTTGDEIDKIAFKMKWHFLSLAELKTKMEATTDSKTKAILKEFIAFGNELNEYYNDTEVDFFRLFSDFVQFADPTDESINFISNKTKSQVKVMESSYLVDIFQNYFSSSTLRLGLDKNSAQTTDLITNKLRSLAETMFMMHVLENYFIRYTSNMTIFNQAPLVKDENWTNYAKTRNIYNYSLYLNFIANNLQNFRYFGGVSYADIWFEPDSTSKISFAKQDNLFLPQPSFTLKLDQNGTIATDTYNNFPAPYYFVIFQIVIAGINFYFSRRRFIKMDFIS